MSDRFWLALATLGYGLAFIGSFYRAPSRLFKPTPLLFSCFVVTMGFHTTFLIQRGNIIQHCPVSTLFEILIFVAWSLGLAYLIVGPLYRMTLLGALTTPSIFLILLSTQLFIHDKVALSFPKNPALELHAALNILAYGALGLAGLIGAVFLLQENWLKRKQFTGWLAYWPSLHELARVQRHLLAYGLTFLTFGIAAGLFIWGTRNWLILSWAVGVWVLYLGLLVFSSLQRLSNKKTALFSLLIYVILLSTFWNTKHIPYS
ncbi:MAG: cytochrome c biogenesis protein CcsA [Verrucomicrobiia bacterium]